MLNQGTWHQHVISGFHLGNGITATKPVMTLTPVLSNVEAIYQDWHNIEDAVLIFVGRILNSIPWLDDEDEDGDDKKTQEVEDDDDIVVLEEEKMEEGTEEGTLVDSSVAPEAKQTAEAAELAHQST